MLYVRGLASCHTHRQKIFIQSRFQRTKLEVSVYREAKLLQSAIAIVPVEQPGFHESNFEAVSRLGIVELFTVGFKCPSPELVKVPMPSIATLAAPDRSNVVRTCLQN